MISDKSGKSISRNAATILITYHLLLITYYYTQGGKRMYGRSCRLLIFLLCAMLPVLPAGQQVAPPAPGASLAQMALFDLHGQLHRMDEVKTKRVVVVFWAFWCNTWKSTLPQLQALDAVKREEAFSIWTVSVDGAFTDEIRPLADAGCVPFPILLDDGGWKKTLGLRRVPTVLILDASRTVKKVYEGYPGNAVLESALRQVK